MKILVVGDIHFSQYSSIIRKRGEYYSKRLENCIQSIIWAEKVAENEKCDKIVYLGDFFDKPDLNAEEITALREIEWPNRERIFLVGNHELSGTEYNSANVLEHFSTDHIVSELSFIPLKDCLLVFIPYIIGDKEDEVILNSKVIEEALNENKKIIAFSHNDLKDVQMGAFISKNGFSLELLEETFNIFLNGHLHNGCKVRHNKVTGNVVINVGNLTGQNFGEDARRYQHHVYILDTDDLTLTTQVNPYAYNFYKDEVNSLEEFNNLLYKNHAIVSIKCPESISKEVSESLQNNSHVEEFRMISVPDLINSSQVIEEEFTGIDHIDQFKKYVKEQLDNTDILMQELQLL